MKHFLVSLTIFFVNALHFKSLACFYLLKKVIIEKKHGIFEAYCLMDSKILDFLAEHDANLRRVPVLARDVLNHVSQDFEKTFFLLVDHQSII